MDKILYLISTEIIDWKTPAVLKKAEKLAVNSKNELDVVKKCFEFVRDEIYHSVDYQMNPVTLKASDVLTHRTGFCYAKSHLLAALLRANMIPAGFCYQRVRLKNYNQPYGLHGFNAVFLEKFGWVRVDARGNKEGVNAQFDPPYEKLAFHLLHAGEADFSEIWYDPIQIIIEFLSNFHSYEEAVKNLPDIEIINKNQRFSGELHA